MGFEYWATVPKHDECQFFTDSYYIVSSSSDADQFQCLILQVKDPEDPELVEIKPISREIEDFVTDESHVTKQLTFTLPKNSLAAERGLGARRITIDGDQTEYLEVEVVSGHP